MTTTATIPSFTGPYSKLLTELADLIDWLWVEHGTSFVKAGDDKVYAFGGNGIALVLDGHKWQGLIELSTPKGMIAVRPGDDGAVAVSTNLDEEAAKQLLRESIDGLRSYYERRYWSTPRIP